MKKKDKNQKFCPITYESIEANKKYSDKGLKLLSAKLHVLNDLPFSVEQQRIEARKRADKMSIQGVQLKLSAVLNIKSQSFEICDVGGKYILKPPSEFYSELPENEALTMKLASELIEVPLHGLVYSVDGNFTYFIKRFDRIAYGGKLALEDFSQLAGLKRDTKYDFSMEKMIPMIEKYCTFPMIEKVNFFTRVIFNFLIGNEDMHLKNFSLISRQDKVELAPAYDFINTTIALGNVKEEIALPLHGKKNNLTKKDLIEYFGVEKLGLNSNTIIDVLDRFREVIPKWKILIDHSFLSKQSKEAYLLVLEKRLERIGIKP